MVGASLLWWLTGSIAVFYACLTAIFGLFVLWMHRFFTPVTGIGPRPKLTNLTLPGLTAEERVRFVVISDTHNKQNTGSLTDIPDGDVLLCCGDFTYKGTVAEVKAFNAWLAKLPHREKLVIPGNHDLIFDPVTYDSVWQNWQKTKENIPSTSRAVATEHLTAATYVFEETVVVKGGLRVYGIADMKKPIHRMAFTRSDEELQESYAAIPGDIDVLLTHAPPRGCLDRSIFGTPSGCKHLLEAVKRASPQFHCFGHIHESYGVKQDKKIGTTFINAANCNLVYSASNEPIVFDIPIRK